MLLGDFETHRVRTMSNKKLRNEIRQILADSICSECGQSLNSDCPPDASCYSSKERAIMVLESHDLLEAAEELRERTKDCKCSDCQAEL